MTADNQNLGRFRLSITTAPDAVADPLPKAVREILSIPREQRTPAQVRRRVRLLANHGPGVERRERADRAVVAGASGRIVATGAGSARGRSAREDAHPRARRFPEAGQGWSSPACRAFLNPLPAERAAHAPDVRPLAGGPQLADHGSRAGEPDVARLLRHRPGEHGRESRHAVRAAVASGVARLAGRRIHGSRLEPEDDAPADRDVGDLPAVVARHAGAATSAIRTTGCWRAGRASAWTPRSCATSRWRPAACSNPKVGGPSVFPPAPAFLFTAAGQLRPEAVEGIGRAPTAIGARSTRSAIARCRIRCCRLSTRRTATASCVRRAALEHAAAGADHAERAAVRRVGAGAGDADAAGRRRDRRAAPHLCVPALLSREADRERSVRSC